MAKAFGVAPREMSTAMAAPAKNTATGTTRPPAVDSSAPR
jgi:hypothetical protein